MHLEADGAGAYLALALASGVLAQAGEILLVQSFRRKTLLKRAAAAVVNEYLQVHLGLAAQLVDVAKELALIDADGPSQALVVVEDGPKPEGQHRGMLEAAGHHPRVIDAGSLVESFMGVVFADNDGKVTGGIKKNLAAADSADRLHRNGFAMTS